MEDTKNKNIFGGLVSSFKGGLFSGDILVLRRVWKIALGFFGDQQVG